MRTILPPAPTGDEPSYRASYSLLTDVFGQGCWSLDRPMVLRAVQIARDYVSRSGKDLAIIHRRADRVEVPAERWQPSIGDAMAEGYCESYR